MKKTLDRILSRAGLGSRTEARSWISDGRVAVNGRKTQTPDAWFDPEEDRITFDGKPLRAARKLYLLLYKPKGYLTTYKDPEGRPTIYDLLKEIPEWVFPAGRLDQDSSGLLLITNDTAFGDYVTSPESHVPKTYLVKASALLSDEQLQRLREGVELSDGPTRPAEVQRVRDSEKYTFFEITLTEGRNRQVRRMVEALPFESREAKQDDSMSSNAERVPRGAPGAKVLKLVRVRIGNIGIGGLEIGKVRALTPEEVRSLQPTRGTGPRRPARGPESSGSPAGAGGVAPRKVRSNRKH